MQSDRTFKDSSSSCIANEHNAFAMQILNIILKLYKSAQEILEDQCLESLWKIVDNFENVQVNCFKAIQNVMYLFLSQIQDLQQKKTISIAQQDYEDLQQSLQKAQSEVRKHIRIQQQLKLYLDGIQQKNQNLQKRLKIQQLKYYQLYQSTKGMNQQIKQLQKKLKKTQQKSKYLNQKQKQKVKGHKSTKMLSQSSNRIEMYSVSMYKQKPSFPSHSKSKMHQKSLQKAQPNIKPSKIDNSIQIFLQKPSPHQPFYQQKYIPTQQDIKIFKQMTKTVQMKEAYKRPVRKPTKYRTQGKEVRDERLANEDGGKEDRRQSENRQYRSVTSYK